MYHRDDGKIVKQYDDLMDATRYACFSIQARDYADTKNKNSGSAASSGASELVMAELI
jgi:hypothetical protein